MENRDICDNRGGQMRVLDMHAHLSCFDIEERERRGKADEELSLRRAQEVTTFLSAGTPKEYQFLSPYQSRNEILLSFGIHPWYADRYEPDEYEAYFKSCDAVGEIGMDSVWCEVPLLTQKSSFTRQLQMASDYGKPVILHTKGQEAQIAELIRDFPGKVCVHWYSGDLYALEKYLEKDCYFTLGPDLLDALRNKDSSQAVLYRRMLQEIPVSRMFVETDGIGAVAWAKGVRQISLQQTRLVLEESIGQIAQAKKKACETVRQMMWENLKEFLHN